MHRKTVKETQLPCHQSKILKRSSPIGPKIKSRIHLPKSKPLAPPFLSVISLSLSASSSRPQRRRCGRRRRAQAGQSSSRHSPSTSLSRLLSSALLLPLTGIDRPVRRGGGARSAAAASSAAAPAPASSFSARWRHGGMHAAPLRHRAPPHHPCVQGARAPGHEVEAHGLAATPSSIVSAAGDTAAMAPARTSRLHGRPGSWRASIRGHAAAGWRRHRRQAGGGTGGRLVGLPDFFYFYVFQKCSPSVAFTHGKLFVECP